MIFISDGNLLIILKSGILLDLSIQSVIIAQNQDEKFEKCSTKIDYMNQFNEEIFVTHCHYGDP